MTPILGGVLEQVGDSLERLLRGNHGELKHLGREVGHKILGYLRALLLHFLTKYKSKAATLRF
jgi:hypothetical protein